MHCGLNELLWTDRERRRPGRIFFICKICSQYQCPTSEDTVCVPLTGMVLITSICADPAHPPRLSPNTCCIVFLNWVQAGSPWFWNSSTFISPSLVTCYHLLPWITVTCIHEWACLLYCKSGGRDPFLFILKSPQHLNICPKILIGWVNELGTEWMKFIRSLSLLSF